MGIESFGVVLRAERSSSLTSIRQVLQSYENLKLLKEGGSEATYECDDGECLFEVLLRGDDNEKEFDLSVRFSLCNPDAVESRFLEFIAWAGRRWHPQLWQMSSASKEKVSFNPDELHLFEERAPSEIRTLRNAWQRTFGMKRGAVRVKDVYNWLKTDGVPPIGE